MSETESAPRSDAALIAQAKQGDLTAYGALYERYLDPIYRYLRARVNQREDAEDLCENVFLRSFEALYRYRERGHPFSAYLYQVARNLLVDHYRSGDGELALDEVDEPVSQAADPETAVERGERIEGIAQAMTQLREDYREVIRLRVLLGLPTDTVGEWMDRSPGAVRVLLHRALRALREEIGE